MKEQLKNEILNFDDDLTEEERENAIADYLNLLMKFYEDNDDNDESKQLTVYWPNKK